MEKNNNNNHHNRERALNGGGSGSGSGDHGLLRTATHPPETRSAVATTSSDFFLQWGNRKRLRCMKIQNKDQNNSSAAAPAQRTTARVDRRVVRSETNKNEAASNHPSTANGNGYLNLRQRPSSPSHRILRNSESATAMKGHGNGVRGLTSPDRAQDRRAHHSNATANNGNHHHHNNHHHHGHGESNHNGGAAGGGSGSTETAKAGGTSSGSEAIPAVWPPKFVIALSNKEKEEDFIAFKGSKLPQRPKKRAKFIQRTINLVSPGGWLCDLTLERYEVREKKITKKQKPRGLKAMGNMESDSE